jgi:hypothetical protein
LAAFPGAGARRIEYCAAPELRQAPGMSRIFPFYSGCRGFCTAFMAVPIDFLDRWWQHSLSQTANRERSHPMSIQSHLTELERKHQALEREIEAERIHPGSDSLRLGELKRRKLSLKDEIAKLRDETMH